MTAEWNIAATACCAALALASIGATTRPLTFFAVSSVVNAAFIALNASIGATGPAAFSALYTLIHIRNFIRAARGRKSRQ